MSQSWSGFPPFVPTPPLLSPTSSEIIHGGSQRHGSRKSSGASIMASSDVVYYSAPAYTQVVCDSPVHWSSAPTRQNVRRRDAYQREETFDLQAGPSSPAAPNNTWWGPVGPGPSPVQNYFNGDVLTTSPTASLSRHSGRDYPSAMLDVPDLTGQVWKTYKNAIGYGGFSDIYKGMAVKTPGQPPEEVAIKVLRIVGVMNDYLKAKLNRRMNREMETWRRLDHPNILPLYGVCRDPGWEVSVPAFIAPWMNNGDAESYVKANPDIARMPIVNDVVAGLEYMHSLRIVHGDLKGGNVLINKRGRAQLGDFGLSRAIRKTTGSLPGEDSNQTSTWAGSIRWMAPEPHEPVLPIVTIDSDIYAFASTALQILTGQVPFHYYRKNFVVAERIMSGEIPQRPASRRECPELTDGVWTVLVACWELDPPSRMRMSRVKERFRHIE